MGGWNGVYTTQGLALLSRLAPGGTLNITRAAAGTGTVNETDLVRQTSVTGERQNMSFQTPTYPEQGTCKLPTYIANEGLTAGYTVHQIGFYAADSNGKEILYFIAQSTNGTAIPSESEMVGYTATWVFYFKYGQADEVTVIVDPTNAVTIDMLNEVRIIAEQGVSEQKFGKVVVIDDTANVPFAGLSVYGKSTQDGTPTPSAPIDVESIAESGSISVDVYGSNILDFDKWSQTPGMGGTASFEYKDYGVVITSDSNGDAYTGYTHDTAKIACYKNIRYVLSWEHSGANGDVYIFPNGGTEGMIKANTSNRNSLEYIPIDGVDYFTFRVGVTDSNATATYKNIRINLGEDAGFEEYKGESANVSVLNGLPGIAVYADGNYTDISGQQWVCDEIDLVRNVYIQRIHLMQLTGDEEISRTDDTWAAGCYIVNVGYNNPAHRHKEVMCSFLPAHSNLELADNRYPNGIGTHGPETLMVRFGADVNTTELARAAWSSAIENGGKVYAMLETPIETPLNVAVLDSNNPVTTVFNNAGAEMMVDCIRIVNENAFKMVTDITPAKIGAAYTPFVVSATLTAAGWVDGVQTVAVEGVKVTSCGDLYSAPAATADQDKAFNNAQLKVTAQTTGSLTVTCRGTVPAIDLPIEVEVRN